LSSTASDQLSRIIDEVWEHRLDRDVYLQLRHGVPVTRIPGISLEEAEEEAAFGNKILGELGGIESSDLSHEESLTLEFIQDGMRRRLEAVDYYWLFFPITPYSSHFSLGVYLQVLFKTFRFESNEDAYRYLGLAGDYAKIIRQMQEKLLEQTQRNLLLPRPALAGIVQTLRGLQASSAALSVESERTEVLDGQTVSALRDGVETLLETEVVPGFGRLLEHLDADYAARAPNAVGASINEGGRSYYEYLIRLHSTQDLTADEVHKVGHEQMQMLGDQMEQVRVQLGFTGSAAEFHQQLLSDKRFYAKSPEDVEAKYMGYIRKLEPLVDQYFEILPEAPYGVERLDPSLEGSMTYGYYEPPTPQRPVGRYRYNGSQLESRSLLNSAAIIYHELVPGHHFHLARQSENDALPGSRRYAIEFGAFNEGWAEYASDLGKEMGLYEDPYDMYGRLAHERFIASRLVLDTGMNALGWTLDEARKYMSENTLESDVQVATETLRYSTDLPAQALAYRLGHLKILELRQRAEKALDRKFDIRAFHEAILGSGAMPLWLLEKHIDWFINER
jgi:uncharacterized protein (DUF885 family)